MIDEQPERPTWSQIADYLRQDFEVIEDGDRRIACNVILVLGDETEVTREVHVRLAGETLVVDALVDEDAVALGAQELVERAAAFTLGAIVDDGEGVVVRHRILVEWLTPAMLDRCMFGVARDSHALSAEPGTRIDAAQLFDHYS